MILPQFSDHDIEYAYYTQQQALERWGIDRTPLISSHDKRLALNGWLFDLMVNEGSPNSRAILMDGAGRDDLNSILILGYEVYRDTLDTLFDAPHDVNELTVARLQMEEWEERVQHKRLSPEVAHTISARLGEAMEAEEEVDFFVVTGDQHSLGIFDNDTGTFFAPSLSSQVQRRRDEANSSDPKGLTP